MRKTLAAAVVAALALAGCGTADEAAPVTSSASNSSASSSASSTLSATRTPGSTATSAEPAAEATTAAPADVPVESAYSEPDGAQAPSFVQCQMADGTALMSDGTTTYMDTCNESAGGPYLDLNGNPVGPSANTDNNYDPETARIAGQNWWGECISSNSPEYCRANDPYQ